MIFALIIGVPPSMLPPIFMLELDPSIHGRAGRGAFGLVPGKARVIGKWILASAREYDGWCWGVGGAATAARISARDPTITHSALAADAIHEIPLRRDAIGHRQRFPVVGGQFLVTQHEAARTGHRRQQRHHLGE